MLLHVLHVTQEVKFNKSVKYKSERKSKAHGVIVSCPRMLLPRGEQFSDDDLISVSSTADLSSFWLNCTISCIISSKP